MSVFDVYMITSRLHDLLYEVDARTQLATKADLQEAVACLMLAEDCVKDALVVLEKER